MRHLERRQTPIGTTELFDCRTGQPTFIRADEIEWLEPSGDYTLVVSEHDLGNKEQRLSGRKEARQAKLKGRHA